LDFYKTFYGASEKYFLQNKQAGSII